jgi:Uma2 family endonuclease
MVFAGVVGFCSGAAGGLMPACYGAACEFLKEEDTGAMATMPIDETFVSVREYLRTSYSPDCEYVDGRIVERNVGEKEHSLLQKYFTLLFGFKEAAWGVVVYPELRTQVARAKFRIPDVLVVRAGVEFEHVLDQPPLIAIEILSPRDTLSGLQEKIDEYLEFETEHIWIFDPIRRLAWTADRGGLHLVNEDVLAVAETPIRVVVGEVFATLDRA